jgi:hypothetical protein
MKKPEPLVDEYIKSELDKLGNDPLLKTYVPLNYRASNERNEVAEEATRSWLLNNSSQELAIFGNYGSGKTVLCKKICFDLYSDYVSGRNNKYIPIFIEARTFSCKRSQFGNQNFAELLTKYCPIFSIAEKNYSFVIILDGLDKVTMQNKDEVFLFLAEVLAANQRVILTCRTNYFETEQDCLTFLSEAIQKRQNIDPDAARALLDLKFIADFSQSNIQDFIKKVLGNPDWDPFFKIFWTYDLEDISKTPIMLDWLLKILPKTKIKTIRSRNSIYRSLINSWLKRDAWRIADQNVIIDMMKIVAEDMILRNATEISSVALSAKIQREFLQKSLAQISLGDFYSMVRLSGFLSRDLNGSLSFTHRSIMEYFFAEVLKDKIKEDGVTLFRDDEHLLYPESGDLAFGLGPGFSEKKPVGPLLEKINKTSGISFSQVCPLSRGFIELFGSLLAQDKITNEIAAEIYNVFRERKTLREDESVLYSDSEAFRGKKSETAIDPKRRKRAYKRATMIGDEGRIYYTFNVYNFSLLLSSQDIECKWGILVSKTKSWIHT